MTLPIHTDFTYHTSGVMYDEYLNYIEPGLVQSFQGSATSFYHNGISFVEIEAVDVDDNGAAATNYTFDFVMWDRDKVFSPHPQTPIGGSVTDETLGNRLTGCPIIEKRVGTVEESYTQVGHSILPEVIYQSYNSSSNQITVRMLSPMRATELDIGDRFTFASSTYDEWTFFGLGSITYDMFSTVREWDTSVVSFDGVTLVAQLLEVPSESGDLSDIKYMAPTNQKIWIVPLGHVTGGQDSYSGTPGGLGAVSWTYLQLDTSFMLPKNLNPGSTANAMGPYTCITPRIKTAYPAIDDMFKYFILIERSPGFQSYDNGFKLIPISITF